MKPPRISKGPWTINGWSVGELYICSPGLKDVCQLGTQSVNKKANAKAIIALPELLDAAIDLLDKLNEGQRNVESQKTLLRQALLKAGCADE